MTSQLQLPFKGVKRTQNDRVYKYMMDHGTITTLQAIVDIGVTRLGARICDLKEMGHTIYKEMIAVTNRYDEQTYIARYSLSPVWRAARRQR